MRIIFLGAPGAGKGTQAEIIAAKLNIPTVSTGNIIREALKNGTEMGLKAKAYTEAGKLVPDDVVIGIIKERLAKEDCKEGFILDVFIDADFGVKIPQLAWDIQNSVKEAVESTTQQKVKAVNIHVQGVMMPQEGSRINE